MQRCGSDAIRRGHATRARGHTVHCWYNNWYHTVMRNDSVIQSQSAKCKVQSDNDIK